MSESRLQQNCIKYLKSKKIYYLNIHGGGWGSKGSPDLIACINGQFVAFELKIGDAQLRPDQRMHKQRIIQSNGIHYTIRTLDQFVSTIDKLL